MKLLYYQAFFFGISFMLSFYLSAQSDTLNVKSISPKRVYIPDSSVSFIPPLYFQKIDQEGALAFIHPGAFASVQMKVLEGIPYTRISESVTQEILDPQGVKVLVREDMTTYAGQNGVMFLLSYTIENPENNIPINFERLMLLTGTYHKTIWLDANYPVQARSLLYLVLRDSLLSIEF